MQNLSLVQLFEKLFCNIILLVQQSDAIDRVGMPVNSSFDGVCLHLTILSQAAVLLLYLVLETERFCAVVHADKARWKTQGGNNFVCWGTVIRKCGAWRRVKAPVKRLEL